MSDIIYANNTVSGAVGGQVTGTEIGNKRGLDVSVVSDSVAQAIRVDKASSTVTYVGKANVDSDPTGSVWQIQRITASGTETIIEWADGDSAFDNQWSNRSSLTYS